MEISFLNLSSVYKGKKKKTSLKKCYKTKIRVQMWRNLFQKKKKSKFGDLFLFFTIWQDFMGSVSKEF